MLYETDLLKMLQDRNVRTHKQLFLIVVNDLTDYCIVLLNDAKRGKEVVDELFVRWYNSGYTGATIPIVDWIHAEVDAQCFEMRQMLMQCVQGK